MAAMIADFWHNLLRLVYETRLMLEKTESISNWTTQSVGNRANSFPVKITAKHTNKRIVVSLPVGWQPARIGAGYDNDAVSLAKGKSSDIWSLYANHNTPNPERECLALLGYCVAQTLTGSMTSFENSGKIVFAKSILDNAKYQEIDFAMEVDKGQVIKYNLKDLNTLFTGLYPCPARFLTTSRKLAGKTVVRIDIAEKPTVARKVARAVKSAAVVEVKTLEV